MNRQETINEKKNMKTIDSAELKRLQLNILDITASFCEKNGINYWLDSGTLIGAVRHKGYIPWDDDIDIGMLRDDYEKFSQSFNKLNNKYKFVCVENDDQYCLPFGKVLDTSTVLYEPDFSGRKMAVYIDVFVFDNAPEDDRIVTKMYKKRDFLRACNIAHTQKHDYEKGIKRSLAFHVLHLVTKPFPTNFFAKKMSENAQKYHDVETGLVGNFTAYSPVVCNKKVFDRFIESEFEGKKYKIPVGYDEWLRTFYGDYMKLPPEEKRISTHKYVAYYID